MAFSANKAATPEQHDDAVSELIDTLEDNRRLIKEVRYMTDFIHQKGLDDDFALFCETAHEELIGGQPFPRLVSDAIGKES